MRTGYDLISNTCPIIDDGIGSIKQSIDSVLDNNIEVEQGKSVRDYLSKEQLEQIEEHERVMSGLIEFAGVTEYEELKERLEDAK